jgi:hypothetical protein
MILTSSNDPLPTRNAKLWHDAILRVRAPDVDIVSFCEGFEALAVDDASYAAVWGWGVGYVTVGVGYVGWDKYISPSRAHDTIGEPVEYCVFFVIPFESNTQ